MDAILETGHLSRHSWLRAFGIVTAFMVLSLYGWALVADCGHMTEPECPVGKKSMCPGNLECEYQRINPSWTQLRTKCSCYASQCAGEEPCNRLVQWSGRMADYGCFYDDGPNDYCDLTRCWEEIYGYTLLDSTCSFQICTGPCSTPVWPL